MGRGSASSQLRLDFTSREHSLAWGLTAGAGGAMSGDVDPHPGRCQFTPPQAPATPEPAEPRECLGPRAARAPEGGRDEKRSVS